MSAQLFDLGLVLRAYEERRPQPRFSAASQQPEPELPALAVEVQRGQLSMKWISGVSDTRLRRGGPGLLARMLSEAHEDWSEPAARDEDDGAFADRLCPPILVVSDRTMLRRIEHICKRDRGLAGLLSHWWATQAELPGRGGVLVVVPTAKERFAIAEPPERRDSFDTWAEWLGFSPDRMQALADAYSVFGGFAVPTNWYRWRRMHARYAASGCWEGGGAPSNGNKVAEFYDREKAAESAEYERISDPIQAARARWEGRVIVGTVDSDLGPRSGRSFLAVRSTQPMCRFRSRSDGQLWTRDGQTSPVIIEQVTVKPDGSYLLFVSAAENRSRFLREGSEVEIRPRAPGNFQQMGGLIAKVNAPRPRVPRRTVPLDVLLAGGSGAARQGVTPSA